MQDVESARYTLFLLCVFQQNTACCAIICMLNVSIIRLLWACLLERSSLCFRDALLLQSYHRYSRRLVSDTACHDARLSLSAIFIYFASLSTRYYAARLSCRPVDYSGGLCSAGFVSFSDLHLLSMLLSSLDPAVSGHSSLDSVTLQRRSAVASVSNPMRLCS
ncbi:hypothetical protein WMY93_034068 [Mugilogobius chulae]|uniref:Secreted protein n=1 Tax=Mugilogobius chulae TaxID=88201 RepID=A0AAW0MIW7_9GOBI